MSFSMATMPTQLPEKQTSPVPWSPLKTMMNVVARMKTNSSERIKYYPTGITLYTAQKAKGVPPAVSSVPPSTRKGPFFMCPTHKQVSNPGWAHNTERTGWARYTRRPMLRLALCATDRTKCVNAPGRTRRGFHAAACVRPTTLRGIFYDFL